MAEHARKNGAFGKGRVEAFSDGVLAIILTIMVLELKVPHGAELGDLLPLWPKALSYVLSFGYVGIYWNNHHHLFHVVERIRGSTLWHNLHLLFWLSLLPFATDWMGENHFASAPLVAYGVVLLAAALAYYLLVRNLRAQHSAESVLARAVGRDRKGLVSIVVYLVAIALAYPAPLLAGLCYAGVALMWFIPDRRIEDRF